MIYIYYMAVFEKKCFTTIAVLLTLAVFSCNNSPSHEDSHIRYTPDGRPMVQLSVGAGENRRALNDTLAGAGINHYEVAFYDDTPNGYYRATWSRGRPGRLFVPAFDYAATHNAILFAGQQVDNDFTLLAVGRLTKVDGVETAAITAASRSVEFTLVPLLSDVHASPDSTFQITVPDTHKTAEVDVTALPFPEFPLSSSNPGRSVPLFRIPMGASEASFAIKLPGTENFENYRRGIFAAGTEPRMAKLRVPYLGEEPLVELHPYIGNLEITIVDPAIGDVLGNNLITFTISASGEKPFYSLMYFELPVYAIGKEVSIDNIHPLTWHIRGGLRNNLYDEGTTVNSLGGAIVLGVGNVNVGPLP